MLSFRFILKTILVGVQAPTTLEIMELSANHVGSTGSIDTEMGTVTTLETRLGEISSCKTTIRYSNIIDKALLLTE